jgi:hypothetical protein
VRSCAAIPLDANRWGTVPSDSSGVMPASAGSSTATMRFRNPSAARRSFAASWLRWSTRPRRSSRGS